MISVTLSVDPHYKVRPPHVIMDKVFETWDEVIAFTNPLGFNFMAKGGDNIFPMLLAMKEENEYVQVEIELMDVTGTVYTAACLSIEGKEEDRPSSGEVYILTTWSAGKIIDQEVFSEKPTFELEKNMMLRVANINGGDSAPVR